MVSFSLQAPGCGDIKVTVEDIPQTVTVGETFEMHIKVTNCWLVDFHHYSDLPISHLFWSVLNTLVAQGRNCIVMMLESYIYIYTQ